MPYYTSHSQQSPHVYDNQVLKLFTNVSLPLLRISHLMFHRRNMKALLEEKYMTTFVIVYKYHSIQERC